MQKFMSLVLSATMFAYMACGETLQKKADNKTQISSDTDVNQTEETEKILPVSEEK
ncbi:MAG: hypothetical protein K2O29_11065 [Ruminococcus sp.]|nr:hypothetical protein [Ruminococcus sp.]MDE6849623.1 hypothetical protein [Ruminococcus sp.]MDE7138970.1 hypothetical protein [Ruminococcus sp.]